MHACGKKTGLGFFFSFIKTHQSIVFLNLEIWPLVSLLKPWKTHPGSSPEISNTMYAGKWVAYGGQSGMQIRITKDSQIERGFGNFVWSAGSLQRQRLW